ncbi:MAG: LPP20 family lipoprotein [Oligoflexia bacterium]|nr:LPP20 family lipoprotein [Oligoflexia bacterium]
MFEFLKIIILVFLFTGCGLLVSAEQTQNNNNNNNNSSSNNKSGDKNFTGNKPSWINNPLDECDNLRELCAVGEGIGGMMAEANARKAISLIFESKIQSKTNYNKFTSENRTGTATEGADARVDETYNNQIQEITDSILQGVVIKKKYEDKDAIYAYAVLDKMQMQKDLQQKMDSMDEKMQVILKQKGRGAYKELLKLYNLREEINLRYQFLRGKEHPKVVTYEMVNKKKEEVSKNISVEILYDKKQTGLKDLSALISKLLVENDYKVIKDKDKDKENASKENAATTTILRLKGKFETEEQFLNVDGFKRFKFHMALNFQNSKGEKVHVTEHTVSTDGRSFEHCYEKAIIELRAFLIKEWEILTVE